MLRAYRGVGVTIGSRRHTLGAACACACACEHPARGQEQGPACLAAGIGGSRAEILRWTVSRIREHPAYAQLQDRVHEISQLKAQF
jgi:hypothetical protein